MMINNPKRYWELKDMASPYYVPVWNEDHTDILQFQLNPDAPEKIKKAYEEAMRIKKETEGELLRLIEVGASRKLLASL